MGDRRGQTTQLYGFPSGIGAPAPELVILPPPLRRLDELTSPLLRGARALSDHAHVIPTGLFDATRRLISSS